MQTFEIIRNLRKKMGITREEFAKILDVSSTTIYLWENKKCELKNYEIMGIMMICKQFFKDGVINE